MFIPGVIIAILYYNNFELKNGLLIGAFLQALGSGIKLMINLNFNWMLVGQALWALAQPFIIITPAALATKWFEESLRNIVMIFGWVFFSLGTAVGFLEPVLIIDDETIDIEKSKHQIFIALLIQTIFGILTFLLPLFTLTKRPKVPPSWYASYPKDDDILGSFIELFTSRHYVIHFIWFSFYFSNIMILTAIFDIIIFSFENESTTLVGWFGLSGVIGGFVGLLVYSLFLK